ncbi:hypothetical protein [Empedobacter brevis]|uniref:hypothetical protein n=1 Tax=Empedobacter brevis TaxID=247 RepID=UPI00333F7256
MKLSSNWNKDLKKEAIIAQYLDIYFYSNPIFTNWIRIKKIELQKEGIDTIIDVSKYNITNGFVDEKSQIYYTNGGLPTFAFELNYFNKQNKRIEGWLTDFKKKTEYYLLIWLTAKSNFSSLDEIYKIEFALIERNKILNYLGTYNLDITNLKLKGFEIAKSNLFRQEKIDNKDFWFTHSTQLKESPVNIVIKKSTLLKISTLNGIINTK